MSFSRWNNSPEIFKKWGAITTIGAALQRKCYMHVQRQRLYPNIWCAMVGPPGVGKTSVYNLVKGRLNKLQNIKQLPSFITHAKLIKSLADANKLVMTPQGTVESMCNSALFLSELVSIFRPGEELTQTALIDIYDCGPLIENSTIGRGSDRAENVFMAVLGGATPRGIAQNLGRTQTGIGLTARFNWIYSEEVKMVQIEPDEGEVGDVDWTPIDEDIKEINKLWGRFSFAPGVREDVQAWMNAGMKPIPSDAKMAEYVSRRGIHLLKLCMITAAAENSEMIIRQRHYEQARSLLLEAESTMARTFQMVGLSDAAQTLRDLLYWMRLRYVEEGRAISMALVRKKLLDEIQPAQVMATINEMIGSNMVKMISDGKEMTFIPLESEI